MVKHGDFKTSSQSSFYQRNHQLSNLILNKTIKATYKILPDSVHLVDSSIIEAVIKNDHSNFPIKIQFSPSLGNVRINIAHPEKKHFDVQNQVIKQSINLNEAHPVEFIKTDTDASLLHVEENIKLILNYEPFKVLVYQEDVLFLAFNSRELFNFEVTKVQHPVPEGNNNTGFSEEQFNGFTDTRPNGPESVAFDLTFCESDNVYGIPEHATSLNLKDTNGGENAYNEPYRLYNLDVFEYELDSPMALYGSIPFMLSHGAKGSTAVLFLNSAEMWIDVNRPDKNQNLLGFPNVFRKESTKKEVNTHWIAETGPIDVLLFFGKSPKEIMTKYTKIVGTSFMPPLFAIGHHQCRWNYVDQKDVIEVNDNYEKSDIGLDVIWLDIEHTDGKKYFTWDNSNFPEPHVITQTLDKYKRKLVTIVDPHIKRDDEYYIYKEAKDLDFYIKDKDKNTFDGWCWPGSSSWLDLTNPNSCKWWIEQFKHERYNGSASNLFIWNDMNEPSVSNGPEATLHKDAIHYDGWEHRHIHNIYGHLFHKTTSTALIKREIPNKRPFVLTRSFFIGSQVYSAVWTGDNFAKWDHLEISNPMTLTLGISGIGFSGADVGGFFENTEPELLLRWYQTAIFQPFLRAHAHIDTKRRECYLMDEPFKSLIREAIRIRYTLVSYWYTLFFENNLSGVPSMRPMFFEYPQDEKTFSMDDQFMLGPSLLVKPVTKKDALSVDIYLPKDDVWYNFFTHEKQESGQQRIDVDLSTIPLYIRSGSIIPLKQRIRRSISLSIIDPITLIIALDKKDRADGVLYVDDGETYSFMNHGYLYTSITYNNGKLSNRHMKNVTITNYFDFEPEISNNTDQVLQEVLKTRIERIVLLGVVGEPKTSAFEYEYENKNNKLTIKNPKLKIGEEWDYQIY